MTSPCLPPLTKQSGVLLLEALIAILIFSIGILGIVGMHAAAVTASTDAKYRSDAALVANDLIGKMWVSDRTTATLQGNFNTGGPLYTDWLGTSVVPALPGAAANPPTVVIDNLGQATITVSWQLPSDPVVHQYVTVAQVR